MVIRICKKCFYEINEKGVNGMHKECFYNIRIPQCIKCEMPLICFHQTMSIWSVEHWKASRCA